MLSSDYLLDWEFLFDVFGNIIWELDICIYLKTSELIENALAKYGNCREFFGNVRH